MSHTNRLKQTHARAHSHKKHLTLYLQHKNMQSEPFFFFFLLRPPQWTCACSRSCVLAIVSGLCGALFDAPLQSVDPHLSHPDALPESRCRVCSETYSFPASGRGIVPILHGPGLRTQATVSFSRSFYSSFCRCCIFRFFGFRIIKMFLLFRFSCISFSLF